MVRQTRVCNTQYVFQIGFLVAQLIKGSVVFMEPEGLLLYSSYHFYTVWSIWLHFTISEYIFLIFILILFFNQSLSLPSVLRFSKIKTFVLLCFILLGNVNLLFAAKNSNYEARHYVSRLTTVDIYIGLFLFHTTDQRVAFRFCGHNLVSWSTVNEFILLIPAGQILTRKLSTAI